MKCRVVAKHLGLDQGKHGSSLLYIPPCSSAASKVAGGGSQRFQCIGMLLTRADGVLELAVQNLHNQR